MYVYETKTKTKDRKDMAMYLKINKDAYYVADGASGEIPSCRKFRFIGSTSDDAEDYFRKCITARGKSLEEYGLDIVTHRMFPIGDYQAERTYIGVKDDIALLRELLDYLIYIKKVH